MFTFVDLFAGIGGFRVGIERVGGKCVFSCENNPHACEMYEANFGVNSLCNIKDLDTYEMPDFDVLCAGFPCQAFSKAGFQKGFEDTRGTLFFEVIRVLNDKKPKAFILENVAHLEKHDNGNTFLVMLNNLKELGYTVSYKVLNAKDFGVPQNRERIILVGSLEGISFDFSKLQKNSVESMKGFLDTDAKDFLSTEAYTLIDSYKRVKKSGIVFRGYLNVNQRKVGIDKDKLHLSRAHRQYARIYSDTGNFATLMSQEGDGRYHIYLEDLHEVRKLTIRECYRIMGFPEDFVLVGSKGNLHNRIGNSICVNVVEAVGKEMVSQFNL